MRRIVRRLVLWAVPELRATVEREQWLAVFHAALQQQARLACEQEQAAPMEHN